MVLHDPWLWPPVSGSICTARHRVESKKQQESTLKGLFKLHRLFPVQSRYFVNQTDLYVLTKHINQCERD